MADRAGHQGCHPKQVEPQTTFQLRQEILQTATPHRECLLPAQRFPTHRHPLRQARQKFPRLRLPRRCRCMLDFMSRDPSYIAGGSTKLVYEMLITNFSKIAYVVDAIDA